MPAAGYRDRVDRGRGTAWQGPRPLAHCAGPAAARRRPGAAGARAASSRRRAGARRLRLRARRRRGLARGRAARDPRAERSCGTHQPLPGPARGRHRRGISGQLSCRAGRDLRRQSRATRDCRAAAAAAALRFAQRADAAVRVRRQPGRNGAQPPRARLRSRCCRNRAGRGCCTRPARRISKKRRRPTARPASRPRCARSSTTWRPPMRTRTS